MDVGSISQTGFPHILVHVTDIKQVLLCGMVHRLKCCCGKELWDGIFFSFAVYPLYPAKGDKNGSTEPPAPFMAAAA